MTCRSNTTRTARMCPALCFDEPFPDGEAGQVDPVGDAQLLHQMTAVLLHRLHADIPGAGDGLFAHALRDAAERGGA